jgi:Cu/Ag efflux protein CusF
MNKLAAVLALSVASLSFSLAGCAKNPPPVKEYVLKGEVLKLDPSAQLVSVKGEKIEGWMEAMTMDYPVKDKQVFDQLKVGDNITAKVLVQGTDYWVTSITESAPTPVQN